MTQEGSIATPPLPLAGQRVVITRARAQASALSRQIAELGGEPYEFPVIQIAWAEDLAPLDAAQEQLRQFDWVMFTSVNAVEMFWERLLHNNIDIKKQASILATTRFAAVGSKTAAALQKKGVSVEVVAEEFQAEGLLDALGDRVQVGQNVLLPRANIARKNLPDALRARGCVVTEVELYRTLPLTDNVEALIGLLRDQKVNFITFTSSSTVKNFLKALQGQPVQELLAGVALAAIGPVTAKTATDNGLTISVMPTEYTIDGLVAALVAYKKQQDKRNS